MHRIIFALLLASMLSFGAEEGVTITISGPRKTHILGDERDNMVNDVLRMVTSCPTQYVRKGVAWPNDYQRYDYLDFIFTKPRRVQYGMTREAIVEVDEILWIVNGSIYVRSGGNVLKFPRNFGKPVLIAYD
jgi:hypothetical protein